MKDLILPQKHPDEVMTITFNFTDLMQFGEVLVGAGVAAATFIGGDITPSLILSGSPTITSDGQSIQQVVIDGEPGNIYNILCTASTDQDHVYTKAAKLSIIRPVEAFVGS